MGRIIDELLEEWAYGLARQVGEVLLKRLDDELMEGREEGLRMVGFKGWWVTTLFGDVRVRRRVYRDRNGEYRTLSSSWRICGKMN